MIEFSPLYSLAPRDRTFRFAGESNRFDQGVAVTIGEIARRAVLSRSFDALTGTGLRDRAYTWTAGSHLLPAEAPAHRDSR